MLESNVNMSPNYVKTAVENEDVKHYSNIFKVDFIENDESKGKLSAEKLKTYLLQVHLNYARFFIISQLILISLFGENRLMRKLN